MARGALSSNGVRRDRRGTQWLLAHVGGVREAGGLAQEALDDVGRKRAREQESLGEVAPLALQLANLAVVLDALGERLQPQRLAELDQRVRERVRLAGEL